MISFVRGAAVQVTRGVSYARGVLDATEAVGCIRQGDYAGATTHAAGVAGRMVGTSLGMTAGFVAGSLLATPKLGGIAGVVAGGVVGAEYGEEIGRSAGAWGYDVCVSDSSSPPSTDDPAP